MNRFYVMKYESNNIGDDIQSIATSDILDEMNINYEYVYRDLLNGYNFSGVDRNHVIFNGWFTNGFGLDDFYTYPSLDTKVTWPPVGNFTPIFHSYHISEWGPIENRKTHECFLNGSIDFYKKSKFNIGCRDENTERVLKSVGVDCFLSKCLTLTLNKNKYRTNNVREYIVLNDVSENICNTISQKINIPAYKNTHFIPNEYLNILDRKKLAKRYLKQYCNARLVVTTRLHVFLPCKALGTPVVMVYDDGNKDDARIRDYLNMFPLNCVHKNNIENINIEAIISSDNISGNFSDIKNEFIQRINASNS